jgi:hypothetical protein
MEFAQFENDSVSRSVTDSKWTGTPGLSAYFVAATNAAGLIFTWIGLCAI